ncbi:hypothetical protein FQR65_LT13765 [Abscondita terminalis]|nr:hypothetical protein FQR65_LT13765 [Abscondita terminalis]
MIRMLLRDKLKLLHDKIDMLELLNANGLKLRPSNTSNDNFKEIIITSPISNTSTRITKKAHENKQEPTFNAVLKTDIKSTNHKNVLFKNFVENRETKKQTVIRGSSKLESNLKAAHRNADFVKPDANKSAENKCKALIILNVDDKNLSLVITLILKDYVNEQNGEKETINEYIYSKNETYKNLDNYDLKIQIEIGIILIGLQKEYDAAIRSIDLNASDINLETIKRKL